METLSVLYLWLKAAHLIFVIFWMAGLFMLPRLYVYHQEALSGSEEAEKFAERERKLLKIILNPSMILVWILGLTLAFTIGAWSTGWFGAKLLLVIGLSGYHGYLIGYGKKLARGERPLSGKALRLLNEVPAIAIALIVVLVIVKPF
ncbi:protoporphyrinogen oxidase HemJ [Novosphingopyxis baekryungensis]|uniref:protoporphyrinogen oxidase HemJ n=1 Tax=Novosphingopyxis baekryungensis TaxID=279369 RepID=UPI0003B78AC6|nr:protoporphyrinogen oxidase HemJ [Novosphingopyxis baekryungensis]